MIDYSVSIVRPDPNEAQMYALFAICHTLSNMQIAKPEDSYLPGDKGSFEDAVRRRVDLYFEEEKLNFLPRETRRSSPYKVASYFNRSNPFDKLKALFNVTRQSVIDVIKRHKVTMPEVLRGLYETLGIVEEPKSTDCFDETFVAARYLARDAGRQLPDRRDMEKRSMREYLKHCAGIWLIYRLSSNDEHAAFPVEKDGKLERVHVPRTDWADATSVKLEDVRVNVGLLRITAFQYLEKHDHRVPRFSYSFRRDRRDNSIEPIMRARGVVVPLGRRTTFIGQLNPKIEEPALVSLTWTEHLNHDDETVRNERPTGIGFAANASLDRVAFYFIARYVPGTEDMQPEVYDKMVPACDSLVGSYSAVDMARALKDVWHANTGGDSSLSALKLELPVLEQNDVKKLVYDSACSLVFKK